MIHTPFWNNIWTAIGAMAVVTGLLVGGGTAYVKSAVREELHSAFERIDATYVRRQEIDYRLRELERRQNQMELRLNRLHPPIR